MSTTFKNVEAGFKEGKRIREFVAFLNEIRPEYNKELDFTFCFDYERFYLNNGSVHYSVILGTERTFMRINFENSSYVLIEVCLNHEHSEEIKPILAN